MTVAMLTGSVLALLMAATSVLFITACWITSMTFRSWLIIAVADGLWLLWNPQMLKMYRRLYRFKIRGGQFVGMDEMGRECKDEDWQPRA